MLTPAFWVWLHRWVGLAMAGFPIIVGLTGSQLAFWLEINHWLTPEMYPGDRPGIALDASTLARHAEAIVPQAQAKTVYLGLHPRPRHNDAVRHGRLHLVAEAARAEAPRN